eukprot:SAG31_NODE_1133_length_9745_cov_5.676343_2_plen_425_part_00
MQIRRKALRWLKYSDKKCVVISLACISACSAALPPDAPPRLPRCASQSCPNDFHNNGIAGKFPSGADACFASKICVRDVFPGCSRYGGDSDAPWGGPSGWCQRSISEFDENRTLPQSVVLNNKHRIYYFEPPTMDPKPPYILYLPPSGNLPINSGEGRYEYFLLQWFKDHGIAVFVVPPPIAGFDLWDHVPAPHIVRTDPLVIAPYNYNCSTIRAGYTGMCNPSCDMCEKNRSLGLIEAAIDHAASLGYSQQRLVLMGWSSGGAMASAFLDHANKKKFTTPRSTRYSISGMAIMSSGSQYCYAYDQVSDLKGSDFWSSCTDGNPAKVYGCCPSNLTEDYFWRNPSRYPHHPPTLVVQSLLDSDSDWYSASFYHETMVAHGAKSVYFQVGGSNHATSPAVFGVVASWVFNLLGLDSDVMTMDKPE